MKTTKMLRSLFAQLTLSLVCCAAFLVAQTSPTQASPSETSPAQPASIQTSPAQASPAPTSPSQTSPTQAVPAPVEPQLSNRDAASQQAVAAASSFEQVVDR